MRRSRETSRPRAAAGHPVRLGQHAGQHLADHHRVLSRHLHGARPARRGPTQEVRDRAHGSLRDVFRSCSAREAERAEEVFYETFHRIHLERLEPLPGAERSAGALPAALGCYVAVVSNKVGDNLRAELEHLGWDRWIVAGGRRQGCRARQARARSDLPGAGRHGNCPRARAYGWSATPRAIWNVRTPRVFAGFFRRAWRSCRSGCGNSRRACMHAIVMSWRHCFDPSSPYICPNSVAGYRPVPSNWRPKSAGSPSKRPRT